MRIRIGDAVRLAGGPAVWLEVIDTSDPALLTLRAPAGQLLKAGRATVSEVHRPAKVDRLAQGYRG